MSNDTKTGGQTENTQTMTKPDERDLLNGSQELLHSQVNSYDQAVESRLLEMRTATLAKLDEESERQPREAKSLRRFWPQTLALACCFTLAVVFLPSVFIGTRVDAPLSDIEVLAAEDGVEMFLDDDVAFYVWLEAEAVEPNI